VTTPQGDLATLFRPPPPSVEIRLHTARDRWWRGFGAARWLLALAATPLLLSAYADQVGGWAVLSWPWRIGLGAVAVPAALTLATYLPRRAAGSGGSPCAAVAGLTVLFAGMALGDAPPNVATVALASGIALYGLRQRLRGADACGPRGGY
jgi:hypothetical protein